jgi:glycosyltransferase involved in cell wall biosynthesis
MISVLKKDFPGIKACFVGQGYLYDDCIRLSSILKVSENIIFAGHVDEPTGFFQRSKIFVLPSRSEGLPTSMLEAMACGCVPVVSDVGNIQDAAMHSVNAFVIDDFNDINSFVKHIQILLTDEPLRKEMAEKGIQTVKENYSVVRQEKIVVQMIKKLFPDHGNN